MATDNTNTQTIPIVGRQDLDTLGLIQLNIFEHQEVEVSTVTEEMKRVLGGLQTVLQSIPNVLGGFQLDEMQISLEVSAKGRVSLLGVGGEAGGKGGITLKLTKTTAGKAS
jgi:hypothetical protein